MMGDLPLEAPQFYHLRPDVEYLHSGRKECTDRKVVRELPFWLSALYAVQRLEAITMPERRDGSELRLVFDSPSEDDRGTVLL